MKKTEPPYRASNPFRDLKINQKHDDGYYDYGINRTVERLEECMSGNVSMNDMKKRIADALLVMKAISAFRIKTRTDPEAARNDEIADYTIVNNAEKLSRVFLEHGDKVVAHRQFQLSDQVEMFTDSSAFVMDITKLANLSY